MELIAPFSSLENMMEYLRRKKKEFRLTESDLEEFKNNRQTKGRDENYLYESVVETSECQPDFVFDGYGLPAFLETALHVSDEIHVFQSLHDRAVISRERDVSSCEIVG